MKRLHIAAMLVILLLTGAACGGTAGLGADNASPPGLSESASPVSPSSSDSASGENVGSDKNVIMLKGTIGELPVHMSLTISDGKVTGSYYYDKMGKELMLKGSTETDRMISMDEYDENGELTGSFDGWYTRGIRITGTWINAKTEKTLEFSLKVIGGVPANAVWAGEWRRMDTGRFESATLAIFNETGSSFEFQLDAFSGAHTGFIDGKAVIDGKTALFRDNDTSARLKFSLDNGLITVDADGDMMYYGGMGVVFTGKFTQKELPEDTLLTQGYVSGEAAHEAFRGMTGDDYGLFLNSAHLGSEEEDRDGFGARVCRWRVRGLAGYNESIVMFLPDGTLCAAALDPENDVFKVYTDAGDIQSPPRTILEWIADIREALGLAADCPVEFYNTAKN